MAGRKTIEYCSGGGFGDRIAAQNMFAVFLVVGVENFKPVSFFALTRDGKTLQP
jgi:hypothetical protein